MLCRVMARPRKNIDLAAVFAPDYAPAVKPVAVVKPEPEPVVAVEPKVEEAPTIPVREPLTFAQWLLTNEGKDCSDPRLPTDRVRLAADLIDRLQKAWNTSRA